MNKKNVVLLGGSNSVMVDGLQKGIRQGIELHNQNKNITSNLFFCNLALGANDSCYKLFTLLKPNNQKILNNAELIIIETNINDYDMSVIFGHSLNKINTYLEFTFKQLKKYNTKILFLILPLHTDKFLELKSINNFSKKLIKKYNFNHIDMQEYYEKNMVNHFFSKIDSYHQMATIMRELGRNLILNINSFLKNTPKISINTPHFEILTPKEIFYNRYDLNYKNITNSLLEEKIYKINKKMRFKNKYKGFQILGIATCNIFEDLTAVDPNCYWSSFVLQNKHTKLVKAIKSKWYLFHSLDQNFYIDNESYIYINNQNMPITEGSVWVPKNYKNFKNNINHLGISYIFLSSSSYNFKSPKYNFEALANQNIEIPKEYNFNHLIPPVELYKEIIDEYCARMDPIKLAPLQNQIKEKDNIISTLNQEKTTLQNELNSFPIKKQRLELANLEQDLIIKKLESKKLAKSLGIKMSIINPKITFIQANSAKARIQNHLSYKLGQALIANSKSILGYIRIPYVLSYIKDKHKFEQKAYEEKIKENPNLALPPLETYPDYNEALKEKECFTYKLGEALMQANKNWYGG
ncbi:alpha-2,3-sialyltransferase, partial [Campylobacter jejuni]|nr:alpha-2,3-sialyltransferase [Campylobacter jejuni]